MKGTWIAECNEIARRLKDMKGQLVGVAVDDDVKADAFIQYWANKHPHIEVVQRVSNAKSKERIMPFTLIQIRLAGQVQ